MSSHHIVREKQEPALVILSLYQFDEEYLGQLLEWSPTVLVSSRIIDEVDSLGIKIDLIISDNKNYTSNQEHVKIIHSMVDELEDALKYLVGEGYPAVNVIHHHFDAKDYVFYTDFIDLVVFCEDQKIYPIQSGFSKWKSKNEEIKILYPETVKALSTSGLKILEHHHYQTLKDGFFSFTFEQRFIFIAEQL
ncbi:MAG: thiamine pyrophosphokinase [Sphingobacteriales bacterium]|nr:thiamine pyrophosphokinase [Sphingobacteriales bacterium]